MLEAATFRRAAVFCYSMWMKLPDEAEFVIVGGRLSSGTFGYGNHNGDFVELTGAAKYTFDEALTKATDMALARTETIRVAQLLFGIPDMENAVVVEPPAL